MKKLVLSILFTALLLAGCASIETGNSSSAAKGSAAGANAENPNEPLETCESPLGTVSLTENQYAGWYTILTQKYRLPPASNLLRLIIQQSNCFVVVERGSAGMNAMNRERQLMQSGEIRQGSNFQKGQVVASDYSLTPDIIFSENTGGGAAALGAIFGGVIGAVAGSVKTREASTMLTLIDNRSGVQVAIAEGSATSTDYGLISGLIGGAAGGVGGYSKTPEGKVIATAFVDSFNQMVRALRNYTAQSVKGQGLGGGGRLAVDGGITPSQTSANGQFNVTPELIKDVQNRLNELGYDVGTPDGSIGNKTRNALRDFQRAQGLPVTGRIDQATVNAM